MRQYALPRIFSSIIFGTLGHKAAGTSEKLTPRITMSSTANHLCGNTGSRNAKLRWQAIMMTAPAISMEAPFPLKSRKMPSTGVRTIARIGKQLNSLDAVLASTLSVTSRKFGAYLWNGNIAE